MGTSLEPYQPRPRFASLRGIASLSDTDLLDEEDATKESWHVQLAPDDVKVMTLEQLDDAYRLDIVDSETLVWNAELPSWQRLGVVAGIEDEEPTVAASTMFPPPPVLQPIVAPIPKSAPPAARSAPPPATQFAPAARVAPLPVPAPVSIPPAAPLPAQDWSPLASTAPASLAPVAHVVAEDTNPFAPRRSRFGGWLLAGAVLAGLVVTLYRNDVLLDVARTWNYEDTYLATEQSLLGGPAWGTPRALQPLLVNESTAAAAPVLPATGEHNRAEDTPTRASAAFAAEAAPAEAKATTPEELPRAEPEQPEPIVEPPAAAAPAARRPSPSVQSTVSTAKSSTHSGTPQVTDAEPAPRPQGLKAAMAAAIGAKSGAPKRAKARPVKAKAASRGQPRSKTTKGAGGGHEFDPLNGKL